ncbi:MAG: pyridoxamine 5'-phosphate oxidase family protein [Actinomycetes bacterium]
MHWSELQQQPGLAALTQQRLIDPEVALAVTIRRDGTPRLSPVEPFVLDGDLWLSMLWGSRKAADLARDPRILVHSIVTTRDGGEGEIKVRGTASAVTDRAVQARYAAAVSDRLGWSPEPGRFHLFQVDIESVTYIRYDGATGDQHVVLWPHGDEFIRRGTSATSLAEAQPARQILT